MNYLIINIFFVIIAFFIIYQAQKRFYLSYETGHKHSTFDFSVSQKMWNGFEKLIENHFRTIVVFLFLLTVFTSLFKLGEVPYGLNVDEAGMAYDAISIVKYGTNRYLNAYPVYFKNYGGGQSAMYTYLTAILIKIFGYGTTIIRLPAVFLRLITFVSLYFIFKSEFEIDCRKKILLPLFLFSISPYFIMQSRWGLDCNLLVGFLSVAVCILIFAIRSETFKLFFLSGVLFGLTLYTYALSYIIIPVFLLLICYYLVNIKKINLYQILSFLLPLFLLAIPLILFIFVNKGVIPEIHGLITIPKLDFYRGDEISFKNIISNFYIIATIFSFDNPSIYGRQLFFNAIPYFGTMYYFSIPFFGIGIMLSFKKAVQSIINKKFDVNTVFIIWLFSVIFCEFIIFAPNINKANAIFVPLLYFITIGIFSICNHFKPAFFMIAILFLLNFSMFFHYYLCHYNYDSRDLLWFATDYVDVVKFSKHLNKKEIHILDNIIAEPYIYVLLENQVPPYGFRTNNIKVIDNNSEKIYYFRSPDNLKSIILTSYQENNMAFVVSNKENWSDFFEKYNYKNKVFGKMCVYYK